MATRVVAKGKQQFFIFRFFFVWLCVAADIKRIFEKFITA